MTAMSSSRVPPGFRFHPTDEELVGYYLQKKVASKRIDLDVIHEIDLYKLEPWDLHDRCRIGSAEQTEWYFFSHKDKKYPTGTRTNRATAAGFWKATGRDKAIHAKYKLIGMRKTLVFYKGRAPNGQKSDWIMHEYRLEDEINNTNNDDGWVVCRVFKKRNSHKMLDRDSLGQCCFEEHQVALLPELESPSKFITDFQYHHQSMMNCKQEFEPAEFVHSLSQQMPQLESPRTINHFHKGMQLPPQFSLPPSFNTHHSLIQSPSQEPKRCTLSQQQQPVTDWRMVDKIVAAQLSDTNSRCSESSSKEKLLQVDSTEPVTQQQQQGSSDLSDHSDDVALLLRLSKQQQDYSNSSANDGDLWSFHGPPR